MKDTELEIPMGLFRGTRQTSHNDRYAIYRLLHRKVNFRHPEDGELVSGFVDDVYRDIFGEELRLTIRGRVFRFKEPAQIKETSHEFVFIYGDSSRPAKDVSDRRFFNEMRKSSYKEDLSGTVARLTTRRTKECRFVLGERKPARRKPFLMRGISPDVTMAIGGI